MSFMGFFFFLMVQSDNEGNVLMRTKSLGDMNDGGETFLDTESYVNPNLEKKRQEGCFRGCFLVLLPRKK